MRVGADNPAGCHRLAGQRDFIAGGQNGDAWAAVHGKPGMIAGGGQADIAGGETPAGGDEKIAGREILAGGTDMFADDTSFIDGHNSIRCNRVFLQQDRIRACGHDAAGEDAHGLAGSNASRKRVSRRRGADDFEACSLPGVGGVLAAIFFFSASALAFGATAASSFIAPS